MIFHASIPARDPKNVASVVAELWGGFAAPFPPFPGAWMAVAGDDRGSLIEVYPSTRVITPGDTDDGSFQHDETGDAKYSAFHMAVATKLTAAQVLEIGAREGWRCVRCTRGDHFFDVIELWIENTTLIEFLTEEMQADYVAFTSPENFRRFAAAASGS
jgi:hypothetical protein